MVKIRRRTETSEAPRGQGATTENTACVWLTLRSCVVGVVAVRLLGAAGCSSPSKTATGTQPLTASSTSADVAVVRAKANAGDAAAQTTAAEVAATRQRAEQVDADAQYDNGPRRVPGGRAKLLNYMNGATARTGLPLRNELAFRNPSSGRPRRPLLADS